MGMRARLKSMTAAMFRGRPSGVADARIGLGSYALESATTEWQAEAAELFN